MPRFIVDQRSINATVVNFRGTARQLQNAELVAAALAGNAMLRAIKTNVSVPAIGGNPAAHYSALAANDHPYASRHPSIQIRPSGGTPGFKRRELLVHTVTGDLANAIGGRVVRRGGSVEFEITTDLQRAPHLRYVIRGTRVMHGRDILWATVTDPAVQRLVRREIVRAFGQVLRTQAGIRFS